MVEELDSSVARIHARLAELGLDDDTPVAFSSDNGASNNLLPFGGSNLPLREGKRSTYEGGVRVSTEARWTGWIDQDW